jgi:hypothetical protein
MPRVEGKALRYIRELDKYWLIFLLGALLVGLQKKHCNGTVADID